MTPRTTGLRRPLNRNPWRELPTELAKVLRPLIEGIAAEMIEVVRQEVPSYRRPLNTEMGRDIVTAAHRVLYQFVELIEDPDRSQEHNIAFFRREAARDKLFRTTAIGARHRMPRPIVVTSSGSSGRRRQGSK